MERCRRGKQHAARRGSVNVLSGAAYGYRYIGKHEGGGEARYQVLAEEARVVRKIFEWVGQERCSIGEVCRRLQARRRPDADRQIGLGPLGGLGDPQEPRLQGDGGLRQDALGRAQAAATPPAARPPRAAQAPGLTGRYILGRSDPHRSPRAGERGPLRGGPGPTRGEPATPSRPARRRPLPAPGPGRLQAVRLRLLRQADEPGRGQGRRQVPYAYYRCTGSDAYRFGGQRLCWNKQVRTDMLDAAVWDDVRRLLSEPERVRAEYERRLQGAGGGAESGGGASQQTDE